MTSSTSNGNEKQILHSNPLLEKSDRFAYLVYKISKNFPKEEIFGITSQIRRASLSIPLNITEGFARRGSKDYRHFLHIAYGSLKESKYLLYFAHREGYINKHNYDDMLSIAEEIGKMLWVSLKTLNRKIGEK